jgi:hypothetical protein
VTTVTDGDARVAVADLAGVGQWKRVTSHPEQREVKRSKRFESIF